MLYSTASLHGNKKKQKQSHLSTITVGWIQTKENPTKGKHLQKMNILFDSGCGATLVKEAFLRKLTQQRTSKTTWTTKAGSFTTSRKCKCKFTLPEFHEYWKIEWKMCVDESEVVLGTYNMIIGKDLIKALDMVLLFSDNVMKWDNATVPMRELLFALVKSVRTLTQMSFTLCMIQLLLRSNASRVYCISNMHQLIWTSSRKCTLKQKWSKITPIIIR